jgi:integrase
MKEAKKERNLKFAGRKWYVDFRFKGKRVRQFGGYTKDQARNTLAKMRIGKLDEHLGFKRPGQGEVVPFEKFAEDFIELYAKQNKRSWRRDEFSLNSLKAFFKGETLQSLGPEKIERYKAMRKAEVSPATVNLELACLKTLFNKAVEWGRTENNPAAKIKKFKLNNAREKILNGEEARRLIDFAPPALRPILIIALKTGMRRGEILALTWPAVNFIKSFILIENSKSGKSRKVPMSPAVREVLKALPRIADFIFYNPETKTHIKSVTTAFETARGKADLPGLRFHDLRHTFSTWYIENDGDIVALSKILGHASIQMTLRYCNPTEEGMLRAVRKMDGILDPSGQKADSPSETVMEFRPVTILEIAN